MVSVVSVVLSNMCDEFFYRVARGDIRMVASMLEKHPTWCMSTWQNQASQLNQLNHKWLNKTALWIAVQQNQVAMAKLLLACKAKNVTPETGLHVASQLNHLEMMQLLLPSTTINLGNLDNLVNLDNVVNVQLPGLEARNGEGQTALQLAVRHNSMEAVQMLLASKADVLACRNGTVLHLAQTASMTSLMLHNMTSKAVEWVINQKAVMDIEISRLTTDRLNMTPLMMAACRQDADSCRLLLDAKAMCMLSCGMGYKAYTALDFCRAATHRVLTSHMLPGCPGGWNKCHTLQQAATRRHGECLAIMLEHKADPNGLHYEGVPNRWLTALGAAACFGTECVELLLASKADVDVGWVDNNMDLVVSALMCAVSSRQPKVVQLLVNAKADVNLGYVGADDDDDDDDDDDAQRHPFFPLREAIRVCGVESFRLIASKASEVQRQHARDWLPSSIDDDIGIWTEDDKCDMRAMLAILDQCDQAAQAARAAQASQTAQAE